MNLGETSVGATCYAPIKGTSGRKVREVRVAWVSKDGFVAEVVTTRGNPKREAFAVSRLKSVK